MVRTQTHKLLETIFATIDRTVYVTSYTDNEDGSYTIETCDTKWLYLGRTITIGELDYVVTDLVVNESITVTGTELPEALTFELFPFYFIHGTIIAAMIQLNAEQYNWNKYPVAYLHQITREKFDENPENTLERESDCEIFFLAEANFSDWTNEEHSSYSIAPMRNLLFDFIDALKSAKNIGLIVDYELFDHAKFGVYLSDKGHTSSIFKDELSGVQLKITIPFEKDCSCENECN